MGNSIFMFWGVLPILDHHYQPLINPKKHLKKSLRDDRVLPCIDFNVKEQLQLLSQFNYNEELLQFPLKKVENVISFYHDNPNFGFGDAEYLYNMIRHLKPKRIIEIGSGFSTLMTFNACRKNKQEDQSNNCNVICIEPYELLWFEQFDVEIMKIKLEDVDMSVFKTLEKNDILFIDSSHIIRPQGDVLTEYLDILPQLNPGVVIHIHDIFTPKDYPDKWIYGKEHRLWNEQYLLEAFLYYNNQFRIVGALNYLSHHYSKEFSAKCPIYAKNININRKGDDPASLWIIKN
jgi:predicted O-methyltransferase YrrM